MEAVKDCLTRFGGNARAFIVYADEDIIADTRDGDLDQTVRRREADCIVEDCVEGSG